MSNNILLSIHCYDGDSHIVNFMLKQHEKLNFPIIIMSPEDSPVKGNNSHLCLQSGRKGYTGYHTLERQKLQMERLLEEHHFDYYLMHDADSVCLCSELPDYLFSDDCFYSNIVSDHFHRRPLGWSLPRIAFQTPYFMSRKILKKFIDAARNFNSTNIPDHGTAFIDFWMMKIAVDNNIPYKNYLDGTSCPAYPFGSDGHLHHRELISLFGHKFIHAIKTESVLDDLVSLYNEYTLRNCTS